MLELRIESETASIKTRTLTSQSLTYAKGEAPVKETASFEGIFEETSRFALRGSKSFCEFYKDQDGRIAEIDVGDINQVIGNIVLNAAQDMAEGGIIRITADNLIIGESSDMPFKPGNYIRISIIKKHDRDITGGSQFEIGTTFTIYLPSSAKILNEREEVKLTKYQGKILVMDNEVSLRKTVMRKLEQLHYESEDTIDCEKAIQKYKNTEASGQAYDAVILDLNI